MPKLQDLRGKIFGALEPLEYIGNSTWTCICHNCGNTEAINARKLVLGLRTDCKQCQNKRRCNTTFKDLSGKTIGGLTALDYLGDQMYRCRCNRCGKIYELTASAFKNGIEMCRECANNIQKCTKIDLKGVKVGSVIVQEYAGKSLWKCKCKCGKEINVKTFNLTEALKNGKNYACTECSIELRRNELTGKTINAWHILEYVGNGVYKCQCKCGDIHEIAGKTIKMGLSKSCRKCGCEKMIETRIEKYGDTATNVKVQRTIEQLNAVANKENLKEFIGENYSYKPKAIELSRVLGISECMVLRTIHRFGLEDCVEIDTGSSIENDVTNYIKSIYKGTIIERDRKILNGLELDIYLPEIGVAVEVNGNYWHSAIIKERNYHQKKTINCAKKGIHLIHIFEYEWIDTDTQIKIKNYLDVVIGVGMHKIGARETCVKLIDKEEAYNFENKYHIQNSSVSTINIGCFYKSELIGILAIGKPRFISGYEYEVIRMCWKNHLQVIGGLEKLYKYFVEEFKPKSVITYSDISKFTGNTYLKVGFKPSDDRPITEPGYLWVNPGSNKVLSRYQTQKHKLVELGLGDKSQTEDEIMEELGYLKIYDSGNIRLEWKA